MNVAFLDRDGTLIFEPPDGLVRPEDFRVLPGVLETLRALQHHRYRLVLVTNQDFTRGSRADFGETQRLLLAELRGKGITLHKIFLCPHPENDNCNCRKPKTGMVDAFLGENDVDRTASFVIGDRENNDGGLANNIGVRYYRMETNGTFPTYDQLMKFMGMSS